MSPKCQYCSNDAADNYHELGLATPMCGECIDVECAVNVYKAEYGVKPRMSREDLLAWLEAR